MSNWSEPIIVNNCSRRVRIWSPKRPNTDQRKTSQDNAPGIFFHVAFDGDALGPRDAAQKWKNNRTLNFVKADVQNMMKNRFEPMSLCRLPRRIQIPSSNRPKADLAPDFDDQFPWCASLFCPLLVLTSAHVMLLSGSLSLTPVFIFASESRRMVT